MKTCARRVALATALLITLAGCGSGSSKTGTVSAKPTIKGVTTVKGLTRNHVDHAVDYPDQATTPPVGGDHNPTPQTCRVYGAPIANEHAVHSLEHGAVWVTYNPGELPAADVNTLAELVDGNAYRLMSPYPGLRSPISLQAWGVRLDVESANDPRISQFLDEYTQGPQTPEQDVACLGTTSTGTLANPTSPEGTAVASGLCSYTVGGTEAKPVIGEPPTKGVNHTTPEIMTMVTNRGTLTIHLLTTKAPCTANSFHFLAAQKWFDKTPCHRLVTEGIFVLQCGDPSGTGTGGPGYRFDDENLSGATYPRGTVAMANSGVGTNGSQFFLVYKNSQLPPSYTPFGVITDGAAVLDQIAAGGTSSTGSTGDGAPKLAVEIRTLRVS